jgi:two-component system sensor histidine kinase/response regulator
MSMKAPVPTQETARLAALLESHILETPAEDLYDSLTTLAAQICGTPVALLGFVDGDRYWVKSRHRWNVSHFTRDVAFCSWTVAGEGLLVVGDTEKDERFRENPLVVSDPRIRFYAGAPILSSEGFAVGTIAVFDRQPRGLTEAQSRALEMLASQAAVHLNNRRRALAATEREAELAGVREALRDSEERFRDLFDTVEDLIMTIRSDGKLLHANGACANLVADGEVNGRSVLDLVHPSVREEFRRTFDQVVSHGSRERIETVFNTASGGRIVVDGIFIPKVVDGYTVLTRVIFRDITDRKGVEIELGKARDAALESARLKSQFLANVSHEVRTPIHAVVGLLGLLLDTNLSPEQRDLVNSARGSADSLLTIINNILHVSRLESGKLSVSVADFDLVTTIERIVEVMQIAAHEKRLRFEAKYDPDLPTIVRGDPGRFRQIINNLLSNAIKFTEHGDITMKVTLEKETETHQLIKVAVTDSGPGIDPESRRLLFQPFTQLDGSASRMHEGVGLGLAISRQLVELMGGIIDVESAPGHGSTFWFTLPFEKRVTERLAIAGSKLAFPGARVLLVDASETNRKLVHHFLGSWGMRGRTAANSAEALERLRTEATLGDPYRAIVFDLHMPQESGLELARAIRRDPSIAETGIVLMTSLGEAIDDGEFRDAGVSAYLAKPVDKSELFDCLRAAMAKELKHMPDLAERFTAPLASPRVSVGPVSKEARSKLRILLAEDKPLNQKLTLSQLHSLGYSADAVANGSEVIDATREKHYDLILMDCQMPLMDGYEATIELRKREGEGRRTRIIAMTANALEGDREKCLAAGMDDYLSKPTRREDLDAALNRWFGEPEPAESKA